MWGPDFEELIRRFLFLLKIGNGLKHIIKVQPVTFCAFDVISYQGKLVANLTLVDQNKIIACLKKGLDWGFVLDST